MAGRTRQQAGHGLGLATGLDRAQVDDEPATVVGEAVHADLAFGGLERTANRRAGRFPVGRPRKWNATDGPFASTYNHDGWPSRAPTPAARASATGTWASRPGSYVVTEAGRTGTAQPARTAARGRRDTRSPDPDPGRDVGDGPPGQHGHRQALGTGLGEGGQPPQRSPGERFDGRRARVAGTAASVPSKSDTMRSGGRREEPGSGADRGPADRAVRTAAKGPVKG